ncbi:hypothetical protein EJ04DRAFT_343241 [Polyplosphaeria fusca]|uniref:Uncharacterized protein n=1 Tax=Polyplosphaeria fusca TaxID=682080 RepID=A0A9P4QW07_9PLEO|nr:hypothetical protein EJ04DRAFT_343241 [Polyplosphaeria fusca]
MAGASVDTGRLLQSLFPPGPRQQPSTPPASPSGALALSLFSSRRLTHASPCRIARAYVRPSYAATHDMTNPSRRRNRPLPAAAAAASSPPGTQTTFPSGKKTLPYLGPASSRHFCHWTPSEAVGRRAV